VEAAIELRMIASIPQQIISPQNSLPIIGILQDALLGSNRFTRPTVAFSRKDAMNLLVFSKMWNGKLPEPAVTVPQSMWTGSQLISAILPPLNLSMKNGQDQEVEIKRGILSKGMLDSDVFSKNLIHIMYNDYGPDVTIDFIDALQAMMSQYLVNTGFSVGISDLVADEVTKKKFTEAIKTITNKTEDMILQVHTGLFENSSGGSNQDNFEQKMIGTLKKATDEAGGITTKSLADNNRMTNMIKSGAKGSNLNVSQMIAVLGQQEIEKIGAGGMSGAPLFEPSNAILATLSIELGNSLPIIGVGGVFNAEDASEKLLRGAQLIQVYTGFVYEGPWIVKNILKDILYNN
jgi:DNA-directed RNA polymerase II subunit RPB1